MKYEILEHKADLKIRVFGKTKEELFKNALLAMNENMKAKMKFFSRRIRKEIKVNSIDFNTLLIDFLSEVLALSQISRAVYSISKFKKFIDTELEVELIGKKISRFGEDIKAVTYHELEVKKENNIWQAVILFDI